MTLFAKLILFASSYSPLMVMWALMLWDDYSWVAAGLCIAAVGSLIFVVAVHSWARTVNQTRIEVASVESRDGEAMSYIVSYLLPFLGTGDEPAIELIAKFVVLAILGILYINSNMIYTNPVFNLLGFHLYAVDSEVGKRLMIVSRRDYIEPRGTVKVHMVGNFVGLEASQRERRRTTADRERS
jgi:hypothetical protein